MPFDPDDPRLTAFALGELDDDDRIALEAILRDDPDARAFVLGVEETARLLAEEFGQESTSASGLDPARRGTIEHRLASAPPATIPIASAWPGLRLLLPLAAVAGIIGLAVAVTLPSYLAAHRAPIEVAWNGANDIATAPSAKAVHAEGWGDESGRKAGEASEALGETAARPAASEPALAGKPADAINRRFQLKSPILRARDASPPPAASTPLGVVASTRSEAKAGAAPPGVPSGGGIGGMGGRGEQVPFGANKANAKTTAPVDSMGLDLGLAGAGNTPAAGAGIGRRSTLASDGSKALSPRGDVSEQIFAESKNTRYRVDAAAAENTPVVARDVQGGAMPGTDRNIPFTQASADQIAPFNAVPDGSPQAQPGGKAGQSQLYTRAAQQDGAKGQGQSQPSPVASNYVIQAPMKPGQQVAMLGAQGRALSGYKVIEEVGRQQYAQANAGDALPGSPTGGDQGGGKPDGSNPTSRSLAFAKDSKDLPQFNVQLGQQIMPVDPSRPNQASPGQPAAAPAPLHPIYYGFVGPVAPAPTGPAEAKNEGVLGSMPMFDKAASTKPAAGPSIPAPAVPQLQVAEKENVEGTVFGKKTSGQGTSLQLAGKPNNSGQGQPAQEPTQLALADESAKARLSEVAREVDAKQAEVRQLAEQAEVLRKRVAREQTRFDREAYARFYDHPFSGVLPGNELSTFAIDVDTGAYANVRRFLGQGQLPPPDAVRIEELLNYFRYDDPAPKGDEPFSVHVEVAACPWDAGHRLARIGLRGKTIAPDKRPTSNLVFLIDVSGSMGDLNKLPLLKAGMNLLVDQLTENDRVAIVTYSNDVKVAFPSTPCHRRAEIHAAINALGAGGGTNGGAGVQLAYKVAEENFIKGGTNRVVLATDGDFNVGLSKDELLATSEARAKSGVFLTVLGFGEGNLQEDFMEQLADKGNGHYAYIDTIDEARKVLVRELSGTLVAIAKDVKIQVEFNPDWVASYRLIGYENRAMAAEDFRNDKKDAGEIGAGHSVTALYEIVPTGVAAAKVAQADRPLKYRKSKGDAVADREASPEMLTVSLRSKAPDGERASETSRGVIDDGRDFGRASADLKFSAAVAGFGMLLRGSPYKGTLTYPAVLEIASSALGPDPNGDRKGFLDLVRQAGRIEGIDPALAR